MNISWVQIGPSIIILVASQSLVFIKFIDSMSVKQWRNWILNNWLLLENGEWFSNGIFLVVTLWKHRNECTVDDGVKIKYIELKYQTLLCSGCVTRALALKLFFSGSLFWKCSFLLYFLWFYFVLLNLLSFLMYISFVYRLDGTTLGGQTW